MPILIPELPPSIHEVRAYWVSTGSTNAQGPEGRQLSAQLASVREHLSERTATPTSAPDLTEDELLDLLSKHRHPPFKSAGRIRMRVTRVSELRPRSRRIEEE